MSSVVVLRGNAEGAPQPDKTAVCLSLASWLWSVIRGDHERRNTGKPKGEGAVGSGAARLLVRIAPRRCVDRDVSRARLRVPDRAAPGPARPRSASDIRSLDNPHAVEI